MTLFKWSTNAANNATADPTCPFPEGMPAAGLNDGARGQMAAVAKYRDDIAGVLVTGGTATAYTLFSNQGFDSFVSMHGAMLCFTPHITNGANGTSLNVDGKGPKPILTAPGVGLPGAVLVQGTPYAVTYNNTDGAFYLHGYFNDPYNIPFLGGMDYWDTVTPNASFIFPMGQAISRTVYSAAFARWGTKFGAGDGSTTFNVPPKHGKVSAMLDPTGTVLTNFAVTPDGNTIGAFGGLQHSVLAPSHLPPHSHSGATASMNRNNVHSHGVSGGTVGGTSQFGIQQGGSFSGPVGQSNIVINAVDTNHEHAFTTDGGAGLAGAAFSNTQPTIVCNYIIRIL
jgi:microcystin-dependent protein